MYNSEGAEFQATFSNPPAGHIYEQFHYSDPGRQEASPTPTAPTPPTRTATAADVCGASWSSTQDP